MTRIASVVAAGGGNIHGNNEARASLSGGAKIAVSALPKHAAPASVELLAPIADALRALAAEHRVAARVRRVGDRERALFGFRQREELARDGHDRGVEPARHAVADEIAEARAVARLAQPRDDVAAARAARRGHEGCEIDLG
jgi:hypothetical protein